MPIQILTIARNAFIESLRQPVLIILVLLCGVLQAFTTGSTGFAMGMTTSAEVSGDNKLLLDVGLATVFVLGLLLAAFLATAVLSREIEDKTVLTVVSKPVARTSLVLGKYLGVTAVILIGVAAMLITLLLAVRHGVQSTVADDIDWPVVVFGVSAGLVAVGVGAWGNFFYGWSFPQTASLLLLPLLVLAYLAVLLIGKRWNIQPLDTDFKPQIFVACLAVLLSMPVICAVATAASTRLGQVMTIVVVAGVFMLGLLSNHFFGSRAILNDPIGRIVAVEEVQGSEAEFREPGDRLRVELLRPTDQPLRPGSSFYYGPNPNGVALVVRPFPPFQGDPTQLNQLAGADAPSGVVVAEIRDGRLLTVRRSGQQSRAVQRPPQPGDYAFLQPTSYNPGAMAVWGLIPNMHYFWLIDAVTQNNPVPLSYLAMLAMYTLTQIGFLLAIGVALFQRRDVG
ncbi:MAG: hypothetical protein EA378_09770 [Phycisphaerales bacterium]|nr:MAG: hypothetical protein EA378_09770 [Phycisphaerales bacterium]